MTTDSEGAFQQLAQNTLAATTEASVELADLFGQNAKNNVPQIGELEPVVDQLIEIVFATQPMEQARLAIELKEISKVFAKQIERAISLVENTSADSAVAKGKCKSLLSTFCDGCRTCEQFCGPICRLPITAIRHAEISRKLCCVFQGCLPSRCIGSRMSYIVCKYH